MCIRSASARGLVRFYRLNLRHSQRRQQLYMLLLCQMHNINSMSWENALAQKGHNSILCTFRTSRQRSYNGLVVYNSWEIHRSFGPNKFWEEGGYYLLDLIQDFECFYCIRDRDSLTYVSFYPYPIFLKF